jgi:hypothetical protein
MNKELKLQIPDSLFSKLEQEAKGQGVSLEAFCLYMLDSDNQRVSEQLTDPSLYGSLPNGQIRLEMKKVMGSDLSTEEVKRRVRQLELQILRCYR